MKPSASPPTVLGIDTSTRALGVAVVRGEAVVASAERVDPHHAASDLLAPVLQEVLRTAHLSLGELGGIAVSQGPGSFTGLRVGVAFVKALAMATGLPVIGISSLEAMATNAVGAAAAICPLLDAKQGKVYAAFFASRGAHLIRRSPDRLTTWEAVCGRLQTPALFLGDGIAAYGAQLRRRLGARALFAPEELWCPRAATVARLGGARLARGERHHARTLVPTYLYPRDCTIQRPVRARLQAVC